MCVCIMIKVIAPTQCQHNSVIFVFICYKSVTHVSGTVVQMYIILRGNYYQWLVSCLYMYIIILVLLHNRQSSFTAYVSSYTLNVRYDIRYCTLWRVFHQYLWHDTHRYHDYTFSGSHIFWLPLFTGSMELQWLLWEGLRMWGV